MILDDSTRIKLACDIAHYILTEHVTSGIHARYTMEANPDGDGIQYTELGQDLFNPIYDTIENMIMEHFKKEQ